MAKKRKYKLKLKNANTVRRSITKKNQKEIINLYKELSKDIGKQINSKKNKYNKSYLIQLQNSLKKEIKELTKTVETKSMKGMVEVSNAVIYDIQGFLVNSGFRPNLVEGSFSYVPTDVVRNIMSGSLYNRKEPLSNSIWRDLHKTETDIRRIVAKGIALGKDTYEIAKDLEKYVNPEVRKDVGWYKDYPGTKRVVDYNAQRLARTMVSHAYQQSLKLACEENPFVVAYRWITADLHGRTCELCKHRAYDDHHGLGPGIYPKNDLPLDHPNGYCEFEPVMFGELDEIIDKVKDWDNSPIGTYPEIDRYVEMFHKNK